MKVYVVGVNRPGYSPDPDSLTHTLSWEAAVQQVRTEIDLYFEEVVAQIDNDESNPAEGVAAHARATQKRLASVNMVTSLVEGQTGDLTIDPGRFNVFLYEVDGPTEPIWIASWTPGPDSPLTDSGHTWYRSPDGFKQFAVTEVMGLSDISSQSFNSDYRFLRMELPKSLIDDDVLVNDLVDAYLNYS